MAVGEEPVWRLAASTPVLHRGSVFNMGSEYGEWTSSWAVGATLRVERHAGGPSFGAEVGMQWLEPTRMDLPEVVHPLHVRAGSGVLFTPYNGHGVEVRLFPRAGLFYGDYDLFGALGVWVGLVVDGVFWVTEELAVSVSVDARGGVWDDVPEYVPDTWGELVVFEVLLGFVVPM